MHFRKIRETDSISHIKNKSTIVFNMGNNFSKDSFDKKEKAFEEDWQDYLNNGNKSRCFHGGSTICEKKMHASSGCQSNIWTTSNLDAATIGIS